MKMTFEDDLATGMIAEQRILSKVQGRYPLAFQMQGKVKAFDIFVPEVMRGIEVKNDSKAHRTGNVFIEYECDGSGSGITTTVAWSHRTIKATDMVQSTRGCSYSCTCLHHSFIGS
mgnify:CR=1 FL=1